MGSSVKRSKPHTKNKNPDRRNGKAWKQGLSPEKRVAGAPKKKGGSP